MKGLPRIRRRPDSEPDPQETQPTTALPPDEQPTAVAGSPTDAAAQTAAWPAPAAPAHHPEHGTEQIPAGADPEAERARPSFRDRGRLRRRLRYLRRVRELGFRDLGGLVFDLHRFGRRGDQLVTGKLAALEQVDSELRAIERVLRERQDIVELHEPGIAACPRCGALHGSEARFCPSCGMPFSGPRAVAEIGEGNVSSVGEIGAVGPVVPAAAGATASVPAAAPEPPAAPPAATEVVPQQQQEPSPAVEPAADAHQGEAPPAEPAGDEPAPDGRADGADATAAGEQDERPES